MKCILTERVICSGFTQADEIDGRDLTVRKKLSFESEEDNDSSSKSWFQYSSDSDWLQGCGIELDEASELEESLLPPPSGSADSPEESEHKGTLETCENKIVINK